MNLNELKKAIEDAFYKLKIEAKATELSQLEDLMSDPKFWEDNLSAQKTAQKTASLKDEVSLWQGLLKEAQELSELGDLKDNSLLPEIESKQSELAGRFAKASEALRFTGPYDGHNAVLSIQAGVGGRDAQDWASMLLRMYSRWAEKSKYQHSVVDQALSEDGIKNATLIIHGSNMYGKLANEHGVHRLVRISPFNSGGSRETSFALVEVLPEIDEPSEMEMDSKELKVDVYRAGGSGGQSVNTTDSAVRVTHLPTGISVAIQNERSQLQNKETALRILRSRLAKLQLEQHQEKLSDLKGPTQEAAWGNQIRNYVLQPYTLVKDSRSGYETADVQAVLGGELDELIQAGLDK